jgi:hypothetical protein
VLDELVFDDLGGRAVGSARTKVELPSNNGLVGSFLCEYAIVTGVEPFEPGPRSVYYLGDD